MATTAQFNFMDGGERASGNMAYYAALGLASIQTLVFGSKNFFDSGDLGTIGAYSPLNFSALTSYWGVRLYVKGWGGSVVLRNSAGTSQISLTFNSDGSMSLYSGSTLLGQSPINQVFQTTIFHIQIAAVISATEGSVSVYLNGNPTPVSGLNVSGVNTAADSSNLPITSIAFPSNSSLIFFRDIYCHDGTGAAPFNGPLGDCGCVLTMPAQNVATQFTSSNGDPNYEVYASAPPGSAYCGSSTVGAADTVSMAALPTNVVKVLGFKAFDYVSKSDTGTRALQKTVTSGSTAVAGAENYLNETGVPTEDIYVNDPATGAQITVAAYNALQLTETVVA